MAEVGNRRGGFGGNATHVLTGDLASAEAFTERMRPDPLKRPQLVQGGRWGAWRGPSLEGPCLARALPLRPLPLAESARWRLAAERSLAVLGAAFYKFLPLGLEQQPPEGTWDGRPRFNSQLCGLVAADGACQPLPCPANQPLQTSQGLLAISLFFHLFIYNIYLFIWLCWVLVTARRIFSCGMRDLVP